MFGCYLVAWGFVCVVLFGFYCCLGELVFLYDCLL